MESTIYKRAPLKSYENYPCFSEDGNNDYIENYEKISKDHIEHQARFGHNPAMSEEFWGEIEDSTVALIKKYYKEGNKILDVGVGTGRLLDKSPAGLDKYGVDISHTYLNIASAKGITCCYALIEEMPYKDNLFDIITCTDVLEHVLDLNLAIANILRVLKPGGLLIMRVPYRENLTQYLADDCPYEFIHLRNFDENSLKLLFVKIFKCRFLEYTLSGTQIGYAQLKYPIPPVFLLGRISLMYYQVLRALSPRRFKNLHQKKEINVVIQKP